MDVPQMAAYTHYETITTKERYEILDITERVERVRAQARLVDGLLLVSTMHITSSIFVKRLRFAPWSRGAGLCLTIDSMESRTRPHRVDNFLRIPPRLWQYGHENRF